ncbi:MAG: hypothetical protein ACLFUI_01065 [Halanaerobiales bacterium]
MKKSDLRLSNILLNLGDYLKKNEKEDIIITLIVAGSLIYLLAYQIGVMVSHLMN